MRLEAMILSTMRLVLATLGGAALVLASCGAPARTLGSASPGPLMSLEVAGHPVIDVGGVTVRPGEPADFTAYLVNTSGRPAVLVSAAVVPVPGEPAPLLAHVALIVGPEVVGSGTGWPTGAGVATRPFAGAFVPPGRSDLLFGVVGRRAGEVYVAAGLRITYYDAAGRLRAVDLWSGAVACISADGAVTAHCRQVGARAAGLVDRTASV